MKIKQFYGFKQEQRQTFDEKGERTVITKLKAFPLKVKRIKKKDKEGYSACLVNIRRWPKETKRKLIKEIKLKEDNSLKKGDTIKAEEIFQKGDRVQVQGISKGKGFAGVVKRWNFKGGPRTHGQSDRLRAPGSIGQGTDPGRVRKGKKMPGRMGGEKVTIKNLKVFKVDGENNEIWITGLVPGGRKGLIKITKNKK